MDVAGMRMEEGDMTDLQRQLSEQRQVNDQLSRSVKQFTYLASHDLQEPLRKIRAFGDRLLKTSDGFGTDQKVFLDRLLNAADRMQAMLDGLLELSRVATSDRGIVELDLNKVLATLAEGIARVHSNASFSFKQDHSINLEGNEQELEQLFGHILANSIKFCKVDPVICIETRVEGNWVITRITDNGIGFDSAEVTRIFEPFVRLVGRTEFEGVGMGLAIASAIAERHGGKISAVSQLNGGTTVSVYLPKTHNHSL